MTLFCNQLPSRDLTYKSATTSGGQHLSPRDDHGHNANHKSQERCGSQRHLEPCAQGTLSSESVKVVQLGLCSIRGSWEGKL